MKTELHAELKALKLFGMAATYSEVRQTTSPGYQKILDGHLTTLIEAEHADRHVRSIRYQMHAARFPHHRDLSGFDFTQSRADEPLVRELATCAFTGPAHNVVLMGGTGTGKTHLASAIGISGIQTSMDGTAGGHASTTFAITPGPGLFRVVTTWLSTSGVVVQPSPKAPLDFPAFFGCRLWPGLFPGLQGDERWRPHNKQRQS